MTSSPQNSESKLYTNKMYTNVHVVVLGKRNTYDLLILNKNRQPLSVIEVVKTKSKRNGILQRCIEQVHIPENSAPPSK